MAEPAADHVDVDSGFQEVDGRRVSEDMRADVASGRPAEAVQVAGVATHDLVDAEACEGTLAAGHEDGHRSRWRGPSGLEQVLQQLSRLRPEWTGPPLVTLAVQTDTGLALQVEVRDAQVGDLLHAGAGVVEQQQQGTVTQRERSGGRQSAEELGDLLALKETSFGWGRTLDGNRGDALCDREQLGAPLREKLEEGPQDRESMVAGAPVIVPFLLQVQ